MLYIRHISVKVSYASAMELLSYVNYVIVLQ